MQKAGAILILFIIILMITSCKINRYRNGQRTGLWITKDINGELVYKSRGRYNKGSQKGTWKYFQNDTLYQKEKYSGNTAKVSFYHPNKKIRSNGITELDFNGKVLHWYYSGDWKYFDPQGNLLKTVTYKQGNPVAEILTNKSPGKKNNK